MLTDAACSVLKSLSCCQPLETFLDLYVFTPLQLPTVEPRCNAGTGKICSLYQGFFISRFFFIYFTIAITRVKKIVHYTEDFAIERFVISRFHRISVFKLLKPQELIYTVNDH